MPREDFMIAPSFSDVVWEPSSKSEDYHLAQGGIGIFEYYGVQRMNPHPCMEYIMQQFKRFGVWPIPQNDLIGLCWETALHYVDVYDPYLFFDGVCDVVKTDEAYFYQYSVKDEGTSGVETWTDVDVEYVETFRYWPAGSANWQVMNESPGLKEYFSSLYDFFEDCWDMNNGFPGDDDLVALQKKYGPKTKDLIHLGIWSAVMWMCSQEPEAVDWRDKFHPIFNTCYAEGSCIVIEGHHFVGPSYYKRVERAPGTCAECGVKQWCIELVDNGEQTASGENIIQYKCEKCSTGERFPNRVCGKRMCDAVKCINHPLHSDPDGRAKMRMLQADKRFGPLKQLPNGLHVRPLPGYILTEMKLAQTVGLGVGAKAGNEIYSYALDMYKKLKELQ